MHRMNRLGAVRQVDGPGTDSPRSGQRCRSPAGGLVAGVGHADGSCRAVVDVRWLGVTGCFLGELHTGGQAEFGVDVGEVG